MKLAKALSQRIKTLREVAGLSQQEVAERGELSLSLVSKLEQGKKADPRASTLLALAGALGVRPGQLLDDLFPAVPAASEAEGEHTEAGESVNGVAPEMVGAGAGAAETNGEHQAGGKKKKKKSGGKKKK